MYTTVLGGKKRIFEVVQRFSQLRRIKNYIRTTMSQERLNHTMVAAVHCDKLDSIDIDKLMTEFILKTEERRTTFAIESPNLD